MTHSFRPLRRQALRLGVAAGLVAALAGCDAGGNARFQATDITGVDLGRDLALEDHEGISRTMADFVGKVAVVFFGFIQCPDVCSTTLVDLSQVMLNLGPDADRVQVLFITVDPERDSQAILSQYVTHFDPRFLGMRGDADATERAAKSFKAHYAKVPSRFGGEYTMEHSISLYLFDREGRTRLLARHAAGVDALTGDIRRLLA